MRGRKQTGRLLAGLLAAAMVVTSVPLSVHAEEITGIVSEAENRETILEEEKQKESEDGGIVPED